MLFVQPQKAGTFRAREWDSSGQIERMSRFLTLLMVTVLFCYGAWEVFRPQVESPAQGRTRVLFSPGDDLEGELIALVDGAKSQIDVLGFAFTHYRLAQSLVRAKRRGLRVRIVMDKESKNWDALKEVGLSPHLDGYHPRMHNKVILLDQRVIVTGSANFSHSAFERNAENLLILFDQPKLQKAYQSDFQKHFAHSKPGL